MFGKFLRLATALSVAGAMLPAVCIAQNFPTKPVRIVLPYPAGGSTDLFVRTLSQKLQESTGQPWVIDYKPGGATMVAIINVKNAPADGYTVLVATPGFGINPLMYKKVDYKVADFTPVSQFAGGPMVMSITKKIPANNVSELVAYIKANPGKINYATLGAGGIPHLLAKMFEQQVGVQMQDIPYKGAAPALQALIAGDVQLYFDSAPSSLAQLKGGNIRIFGVTAEQRMKAAPDLPTLKESGLQIISVPWFGFFVPATTPTPVVNAIHREVVKAVASNEYQTRVIAAAQEPVSSSSPEAFKAYIESDIANWAKVIKPLNLQLEM